MLDTTFSNFAARSKISVCLTCGNIIDRPHLAAISNDRTRALVVVRPSIRGLAHDVARRRGNVTAEEIFSTARDYRVAHARQEVMWEARRVGWSFPMIGRRFPSLSKRGHLDHTTVIHGFRRHEDRRREALLDRVARETSDMVRTHGGRS